MHVNRRENCLVLSFSPQIPRCSLQSVLDWMEAKSSLETVKLPHFLTIQQVSPLQELVWERFGRFSLYVILQAISLKYFIILVSGKTCRKCYICNNKYHLYLYKSVYLSLMASFSTGRANNWLHHSSEQPMYNNLLCISLCPS